jgi:DNA modification methylase
VYILDKLDWKFVNEIIWRIGWVSGYKTQANKLIRNHDTIFYYSKGKNFTFNKEFIPYATDYTRRDGKKPTGKGYPLEDTWNCCKADSLNSIAIVSFSKEKIGYPTQKPLALMERIIKASSNEGDIVLDAFCGGGTTLVAAQRLNRRFIGIDQSVMAITVSRGRIEKSLEEN